MSVTIRASTPQDAAEAQAIRSLAFAAVRAVYRPTSQAVAVAHQRTDLGEIVAVEDGVVVGVVRHRVQDQRLHLIGLAVHPAHQRRGVARQLVDHLPDLARHRGLKGLSLYTVEQTGNIPVFERLGFVVVARATPTDMESSTGQPSTEAFMVRAR